MIRQKQKFKQYLIPTEFPQKYENKTAIKVRFKAAHLLTKQGKPFTDVEFIKPCLIAAAEEGCPENINLFKTISVPARIVA